MGSRTASLASLTTALDASAPFKSIFEQQKQVNERWPIDTSKYESDFRQIDTDNDGLVNGADARDPLMSSGLPQQTLAQIWSLVDVAKNGRINLEQFALVIELTKEVAHGVCLPDVLPFELVPPSIRLTSATPFNDSVVGFLD